MHPHLRLHAFVAHPLCSMDGKEFYALLNACLNGLSTLLLVGAYLFIRKRRYRAHGTLMIAAILVSSLFLVSYLYSKFAYGERTTASLGLENGPLKTLYLAVLIPHVILAVVMLPLIFMALYRAGFRQWSAHTRWSRPAFWIWLYVSVTGVLVYLLLYHIIPVALAVQPEAGPGAP